MKLPLLLLCGMSFSSLTLAQTTHYSYDWKLHEQMIDEQFKKNGKEDILLWERKVIEAILPKERADDYMKQFEAGMASSAGVIRIEGGDNHLLVLAYAKGYQMKVNFHRGYLEGLVKSGENPDVIKPNGNISLRQTSESGLSGWTEAGGRHSKGQWMNGLLKIQKDDDTVQTFHSQYGFIIGWAFSRGDTAVVVQSQNSHGPYYWQIFDIASGKQLEEFFDVQSTWPEWVIDFTGTQKQ